MWLWWIYMLNGPALLPKFGDPSLKGFLVSTFWILSLHCAVNVLNGALNELWRTSCSEKQRWFVVAASIDKHTLCTKGGHCLFLLDVALSRSYSQQWQKHLQFGVSVLLLKSSSLEAGICHSSKFSEKVWLAVCKQTLLIDFPKSSTLVLKFGNHGLKACLASRVWILCLHSALHVQNGALNVLPENHLQV